ncbi:MAG: antibiotic biosynthesis monooxygenase family protein [Pseudomonadota bacterium]
MVHLANLDDTISVLDQLDEDVAPVVLVNVFTVDPEEIDEVLAAWTRDAAFMQQQPGFVRTQLHRGIGGSSTLMNYAVWESVAAFRAAFEHPQFRRQIESYPESAVSRPHLFSAVAVPGICRDSIQ